MGRFVSNKNKTSESASFHISISDIPRDILINIFCKLPTTTIFNCKLVCREFRNTISDPYFAEAHYNPTTSPLSMVSHLPCGRTNSLMYWMEGYEKTRITRDKKPRLDYKIDLLRFDVGGVTRGCPVEVLNSCRGFLLLRNKYPNMMVNDYSKFRVYNPLTRDCLKLPFLKAASRIIGILGLGFGVITKKYKVVCVRKSISGAISGAVTIDVHTVGTNEWRRIDMNKVSCGLQELYPMHGIGNQPLSMNGVVHWILQNVPKIGCFDIDKEEVNTMAMPSFVNTENIQINIEMIHGMFSLGILVGEGCNNLQIWVMRKYGEQESWTKYVVLKNRNMAANNRLQPNFYPKLINVRENGEMVVLPNNRHCRIALYDPKGDGFKWLKRGCSCKGKIIHTYIPSFLSIRA